MRAVAAGILLCFCGLAQAEEAAAPTPGVPAPTVPAAPATPAPPDAKPETHILSEKEMVDDDGYRVRLSLPTEEDISAWSEPGIRIGLGLGYARMLVDGVGKDFDAYSFMVRALARIDKSWAVGVEYQYAAARSPSLVGLRYEATFHAVAYPWKQLALDVGMGFGGLVVSPPRGRSRTPTTGDLVSDVTIPPTQQLGSCDGNGWVGLARAEYQFIAGPMFASGPYLELFGQYTACQQTLGGTDRETGNRLHATQYWLHRAGALGWWFTWR